MTSAPLPRHAGIAARACQMVAAAILLLGAAACRDDAPRTADSSLARDLALANVIAQPQFNDAPLSTEPEPARVEPAAPPVSVRRPAAPDAERAPAPRPSARPSPARQTASAPSRTPAPVSTPAPAPAPAPAPGPAEGRGFAAGTRLSVVTGSRVCTVTGRPGDKIAATLRESVRGSGGATIAAGSTVVLEVASVEAADPAESGRITFRVRALDIDETSHPARGAGTVSGGLDRTQVGRVNASDRRKVIGGAILGAVVGRVVEGSARGAVVGAAAGGTAGAISASGDQQSEGCLPAGSPVTIVLEEGVRIA